MKWFHLALGCILIAGCAITYKAPTTTTQLVSMNHSYSKEVVLEAAKRVLLLEGYQITFVDMKSGLLSTAPRDIKLTPQHADCGTTMGIDYLKDKRTDNDVSINIIVDSNKITVKANIQGGYKPGAAEQNITLTCVSMGVIERDILHKIKVQLDSQ